MLSIVVASSIKTILPGYFDTFFKTVLLAVFGFFALWAIGWVDKHWRFLHAEQDYATITNPTLMSMINSNKEKNKEEANGQVKV